MKSFEERLELLRTALAEHTPESLLAELEKYPAYGPTLEGFISDVADDALGSCIEDA